MLDILRKAKSIPQNSYLFFKSVGYNGGRGAVTTKP